MCAKTSNCNYPNLPMCNEHHPMFETKDSGKREEFKTGMVRDTQDDKPRYDLIDRAFLGRWAGLMARGARKYGENNWRKAATEEELRRFEASAIRHMYQWLSGDISEDHAVAIAFNVAGAEMVKEKLRVEELFSQHPKADTCTSGDPADAKLPISLADAKLWTPLQHDVTDEHRKDLPF